MTVSKDPSGKAPVALRPFPSLWFSPRFAYGEMAEVAEVCGSGDGTVLGTGYVRFKNARIPWQVRYDEIILVIEGRLTLLVEGEEVVAGPRDSIWLPEGTPVIYESDDALVFYAIHPANWARKG